MTQDVMASRHFIAGPSPVYPWGGRCLSTGPHTYAYYPRWPEQGIAYEGPFTGGDTFDTLLARNEWQEIEVLDPDLRLPEGI